MPQQPQSPQCLSGRADAVMFLWAIGRNAVARLKSIAQSTVSFLLVEMVLSVVQHDDLDVATKMVCLHLTLDSWCVSTSFACAPLALVSFAATWCRLCLIPVEKSGQYREVEKGAGSVMLRTARSLGVAEGCPSSSDQIPTCHSAPRRTGNQNELDSTLSSLLVAHNHQCKSLP